MALALLVVCVCDAVVLAKKYDYMIGARSHFSHHHDDDFLVCANVCRMRIGDEIFFSRYYRVRTGQIHVPLFIKKKTIKNLSSPT